MNKKLDIKLAILSLLIFIITYTYIFLITSGVFLEENSILSYSQLSYFGGGMEYGTLSFSDSHWSEWLLLLLCGLGFSLLFFGSGRLISLYQKGSSAKSCDVAVTIFKQFLGLWLIGLFLFAVTTFITFGPTATLFEGDRFFRLFFFVFVFVPHEADLNGGFFYLFSVFVQLLIFYPFLRRIASGANGLPLLIPIVFAYSFYLVLRDDLLLSGMRIYTLFLGYIPMFALGIWSTLNLSNRFRVIISLIGLVLFVSTPFLECTRFLWFFSFPMILFPFLKDNEGGVIYRNLLVNIAGSLLALVIMVPFFMYALHLGHLEENRLLLYLMILVLSGFIGLALVSTGSTFDKIDLKKSKVFALLNRVFSREAMQHWGREALLMLFVLFLIRLSDLFLFYPETRLPQFWGVALLQGIGNDLVFWSWWFLFGFFVFRIIFQFSDFAAVAFSRTAVLLLSLFALLVSSWYSFSGMESWVLFFGDSKFIFSRLETAIQASPGSYFIILFICFGVVMAYSRVKVRIPYKLVSSLLLLSGLIYLSGLTFGTTDGILLTPQGKVFTESRIGNGFLSYFKTYPNEIGQLDDKAFYEAVNRYHDVNPSMGWVSNSFPFWKSNESNKGVSHCFVQDTISPNIVFVVCDGLTSDFSGLNALKVSLTPYLDSLTNQGVDFPKAYSVTLDRQEFIASLFSSIIVPEDGFLIKGENLPDYQSLFSRLGSIGYKSRVLNLGYPVGRELSMYLRTGKVDNIVNSEGQLSPMANGINAIKSSTLLNQPTLDLVLIGSSLAKQSGSSTLNLDGKKFVAPLFKAELRDYPEILSSTTGTDRILRELIESYRFNKAFNRTIFVIVGTGKGDEGRSFDLVDKFHVPCVIWSPLIKSPTKIKSVTTTVDVIPTLERLLETNFGVNVASDNHWMGRVVNSSGVPRTKSISLLIGHTSEECYYMEGRRIVDDEQLYQLEESGLSTPIEEAESLAKMVKGQKDLIMLTKFVSDYNALMPSVSFQNSSFCKTFVSRYIDFESGSPKNYNNHMTSEHTFSGDSAQALVPAVEYGSILETTAIPQDAKSISIGINVMVKLDEAPGGKTPLIVYNIDGKDGKSVFYKSERMKLPSGSNPPLNKWVPMSFIMKIDTELLNSEGGGAIKIYFWNNSKATMWYDDLSINIRERL